MKLDPIRNKANLYRHPKTGIIYFRMYRKGLGECERSTGETSLSKAVEKADKIRADFLGEKYAKKTDPLRQIFEDLWPEFLEVKRNKSKGTYVSIEVQGRLHLLPFFGSYFPYEINETLFEKYVAHSQKENPKRKLFNDWKYLRMFLRYLHRAGRIDSVPHFKNPDPPRKKGKVYSDSEIESLLKEANEDLRLQILMALTMGMRRLEILHLSWDRVDLENRTIFLREIDTKIRKSRTFGISPQTFEILNGRAKDGASPFVFPSPVSKLRPVTRDGNRRAWTACKRRAKVRGRFHDLRHTFLTRAFKTSTNPALICEYAGLSLEEAQRTYLHFTVEDTRVVASLVGVDI